MMLLRSSRQIDLVVNRPSHHGRQLEPPFDNWSL
jgi:hypothetical protein